jgi:hypothetical protein
MQMREEEMMQEQMRTRLETLRHEFQFGQVRVQELDRQQVHLRETLLRISGAIQILEEVLVDQQAGQQNGAPPPNETILNTATNV